MVEVRCETREKGRVKRVKALERKGEDDEDVFVLPRRCLPLLVPGGAVPFPLGLRDGKNLSSPSSKAQDLYRVLASRPQPKQMNTGRARPVRIQRSSKTVPYEGTKTTVFHFLGSCVADQSKTVMGSRRLR